MACPLLPKTALTTLARLRLASSSTFWRRDKTAAQSSVRQQFGQPLAVFGVGLTSGHIFDRLGMGLNERKLSLRYV
jgi:hypothetical protein